MVKDWLDRRSSNQDGVGQERTRHILRPCSWSPHTSSSMRLAALTGRPRPPSAIGCGREDDRWSVPSRSTYDL